MSVMISEPVIVSACLAGIDCRYDGGSKIAESLLSFCHRHGIVLLPVCPEQLGGLPTPRPPACFRNGDGTSVVDGNGSLYSQDGRELSQVFLRGAGQVLKIARLAGSRHAVFQDRSPSCGVHRIYHGDELVPGRGVTTALLAMNKVAVWTSEEFCRHCRKISGKEFE